MTYRWIWPCAAVLGGLVGCSDKGPSLTTGLTNNTLPMNTFPPGPDSSDDDPDPDSGGATEPTSTAPSGTDTSDVTVSTSEPMPTTEGPQDTTDTTPTPDTSDSSPPPASCGDGSVDVDEECDDGNRSNTDDCLNDCSFPQCGDGFVWEGFEACDDGNSNDEDACSNSCTSASCGDGVVQGREDCDDGDASNTDECLNTCVDASCGDGFVQAGVEDCDDGNNQDGDGCDSDCTPTPGMKYTAVGPQVNVPAAMLTGWTICFSNTYEKDGPTVASILSQCNKQNLMMACRKVGSTTYTVLAHAPRTPVTTNTGMSNTPTNANGTGWYFSDEYSWGFAKQGDVIMRNSCDQGDTNAGLRLCWHTELQSMTPGYRCSANEFLNADATWERVVLHAD